MVTVMVGDAAGDKLTVSESSEVVMCHIRGYIREPIWEFRVRFFRLF